MRIIWIILYTTTFTLCTIILILSAAPVWAKFGYFGMLGFIGALDSINSK